MRVGLKLTAWGKSPKYAMMGSETLRNIPGVDMSPLSYDVLVTWSDQTTPICPLKSLGKVSKFVFKLESIASKL